ERGQAYAEAGADIIFVESPESAAELKRVTSEIDAATLVNQVEGGRTPLLPASELQAMGFSVAIFPNSITRLFGRVGQALFRSLRESGSTSALADQMLDHRELWSLFEYPAFVAAESRYSARA